MKIDVGSNRAHTLSYSLIGLQEMNLAHKYPIVFWNCAKLTVEAGATDFQYAKVDGEGNLIEDDDNIDDVDVEEAEAEEELIDCQEETVELLVPQKEKKQNRTVNYGKISVAIGRMAASGIKIAPPNVNKSSFTFSPDVETNTITYGFKGITRISDSLVETIIAKQPYSSIRDFMNRTNAQTLHVINLIKSGAFDDLEQKPRRQIMKDFLQIISAPKQKLTMQNMNMLISHRVIPAEADQYRRMFNFNSCLRRKGYVLDDYMVDFFNRNFDEDILLINEEGEMYLPKYRWEKVYKAYMEPFKEKYLESGMLLSQLNASLLQNVAEKYAAGTISRWEMESLGCYLSQHELAKAKGHPYSIVDFNDLPEIPESKEYFTPRDKPNAKPVPLYHLHTIVGTVVSRDKNKHTVTLLTPTAVVTLKIWESQFPIYDKRKSVIENGKKRVIENSWFTRGNKLMVTGMRRGDFFIPKVYKNTIPHYPIMLITQMTPDGYLTLKLEREKGADEEE